MLRIGQMIKSIRESENVKRGELCRGLCTEATLYKYESGDLMPDSLFFYRVLQRLGKDSGRIYVMMSSEEADYFEWREKTFLAIEGKEWEKLEMLLQEHEKESPKLNIVIQEQYEFYLRALLLAQEGETPQKELSYLKRAIECTLPEFETTDWMQMIAGADEINMVLYYLHRQKENGQEVQKELIRKIGAYIDNRVTDLLEKALIYPRYVCARRILQEEEYSIEERIREEEKAIKLLKRSCRIYDLPQILCALEEDMKALEDVDWIQYEKQRKALEEIMEECGYDRKFRLERWYDTQKRICLLNEQLRLYRIQLGMTQEQASEEICAVEHYSRIENGKKKPSRKNYLELVNRLGIGWAYFGGELMTDKFELYEQMSKVRIAIIRKEFEQAEELCNSIEQELDLSIDVNRQIVEMTKYLIGRKRDLARTKEEEVRSLVKLLKITLPDGEIVRDYSITELDILHQIARLYQRMGNVEKALEIIKALEKNYRRSREAGNTDADLLEMFHIELLSGMGRYEESEKVAQRFLQESIRQQEGQFLNRLVYYRAENMRHDKQASKEERARMYQRAIYLSDLFEHSADSEVIRKQYEREFAADA